ncbi:hypothetical protein GO755_04925 [Spirosoma sp. HMF4905]|uniref:Uncharacterized protein n=1 Tax=Spirosoma arboris TaxID=2682092 RepID=A0A7K1S6C6_9BACT|nr:hypothetical protein [Spirosoma arboris]MVM29367.1 hypothetical protein [Spirosoma arboris]
MGRPILTKQIQYNDGCTNCGRHVVDQETLTRVKSSELRSLGAQRRIDAHSQDVWWSWPRTFTSCDACNPEADD